MFSARFVWFLSSLSVTISVNNVEARLHGEGIIGADLADEGQFPYQALIAISGKDNYCGGAIISKQHILTAAHCVIDEYGFFDVIFNVKVGIVDVTQCTEKYLVERIYVPWKYYPKGIKTKYFNATYDIAVLKLSKELNLSPESGLIALNLPRGRVINNKTLYPTYAGHKAILSGYGINIMNVFKDENGIERENGTSDHKLRFAEATVLKNEDCKKMYVTKGKINPAILCAQIDKRNGTSRGACSADSGGPLVIKDTIIGVLDASPKKCDETTQAATYSRVGFHVNFIENAMHDRNLSKMRVAQLSVQHATADESEDSPYVMIDESENSPDASWKPKQY